ncbi:MAG TPA: aspartate kinase [Tenuifilum sp.]|uniref:aspartate kinase n=1 Tax=Tenuifilum sp. TaxID=2760880 RepID=UPI002BEB8825|nr:aspartate kinase [Tenuifilum sp.]HOK85439.1 aspartate kinase [Tenuifilum sp.]HRU86649.1 aspartate kinase [Tenuifilum sp.]
MKPIRVFKFGGASVKSAGAIRNLANIVKRFSTENLVIVVSAMAKTTNALEEVLMYWMNADLTAMNTKLKEIKQFHLNEALDLVEGDSNHLLIAELQALFNQLETQFGQTPTKGYDFHYDQVVSFGELFSTRIVSHYLNFIGIANTLVDARRCLRSDTSYREGVIDETTSRLLCQREFDFSSANIFLTQGFIAGTEVGTTTTLGREGSDYTAAILANLLDAQDVTIWKDVAGVLSADPKIFSNAVKLSFVSYQEAIELAYCGAQIIHPKTIKPIQNKKIPLYVKSFMEPDAQGTIIAHSDTPVKLPPVLVLKRNQVLITLSPRDFSFVIEDCLSKIFALLYKHRIKVNMVHNSAINFTVCVDNDKLRLGDALEEMKHEFAVRYNSNLELLTIRHYTPEIIENFIGNRVVYLQQRTRSTARFVMDAS